MLGFIDAIREAPTPSIVIMVICLSLPQPLAPFPHFIHLHIRGPGVPQFGGVAEQRWLRLEETLTIVSWPSLSALLPTGLASFFAPKEDEVMSLG